MKIKLYLLIIFTILMLLSACSSTTGDVSATLVADKATVLAKLRAMPEVCSYKGRVAVQYTDYYEQNTAFRAILDKRCDGYMKMTILGPFNVVMGELIVENGRYNVYRDGEDVTDQLWVGFGEDEVQLFMDSFRLPPALPDESYAMSYIDGMYIFEKGDESFSVSSHFKLSVVERPMHRIGYTWDDDTPAAMMFSMGMMAVTFTFTDKWLLP